MGWVIIYKPYEIFLRFDQCRSRLQSYIKILCVLYVWHWIWVCHVINQNLFLSVFMEIKIKRVFFPFYMYILMDNIELQFFVSTTFDQNLRIVIQCSYARFYNLSRSWRQLLNCFSQNFLLPVNILGNCSIGTWDLKLWCNICHMPRRSKTAKNL